MFVQVLGIRKLDAGDGSFYQSDEHHGNAGSLMQSKNGLLLTKIATVRRCVCRCKSDGTDDDVTTSLGGEERGWYLMRQLFGFSFGCCK